MAQPDRDTAGILALIDPGDTAGTPGRMALEHGGTVLAIELAPLQTQRRVDAPHPARPGRGAPGGMSVHRSTLEYPLQRIPEVSGHDLTDPDTRFDLQLASRAWRVPQAVRRT